MGSLLSFAGGFLCLTMASRLHGSGKKSRSGLDGDPLGIFVWRIPSCPLSASYARIIPAIYAAVAMAAAMTFPRIEGRLFPGLVLQMSVSSATAIYSAIASGMLALTGTVFSLAFVMVQFSATAYSPRLVVWIARDPMLSHALGVFTATFLYPIAAITGVDRNGSGNVPFVSAWIVVVLLIASVGMFIGLIQGIG